MSRVAAGTIVAKSYLSFARVLASSFLEHHPDVPFFVLLADEVDGWFEPAAERFHLLRLADLKIPRLERFRFQYPQQPLSYAATPYLLSHLLDLGFTRAVFFKQESLVLGSVLGSEAPAFEQLERHSIVLTPHLLAPLEGTDRSARELNILQSGVFNIGFLGVSETPVTREFLAWWQDRVFAYCRHAVGEGMHWEQRWIDLVPAFFDDVSILRDPGANIGHWNLPERDVQFCRLFRFSGFSPPPLLLPLLAPAGPRSGKAVPSESSPGPRVPPRSLPRCRPPHPRRFDTAPRPRRRSGDPADAPPAHTAGGRSANRARAQHPPVGRLQRRLPGSLRLADGLQVP